MSTPAPLPSTSLPASSVSSVTPLAVSPADACHLLSIGMSHLYGLLRAGELHDFYSGRARRITTASIRAYIERQLAAVDTPKYSPNAGMFGARQGRRGRAQASRVRE